MIISSCELSYVKSNADSEIKKKYSKVELRCLSHCNKFFLSKFVLHSTWLIVPLNDLQMYKCNGAFLEKITSSLCFQRPRVWVLLPQIHSVSCRMILTRHFFFFPPFKSRQKLQLLLSCVPVAISSFPQAWGCYDLLFTSETLLLKPR